MSQQEFTVKLDASDALDAIAKCLETGSVLLSAEAVRNLARYLNMDEELLHDHMGNAGAIFAQPDDEHLANVTDQG